jgi:hypothetical protein
VTIAGKRRFVTASLPHFVTVSFVCGEPLQ